MGAWCLLTASESTPQPASSRTASASAEPDSRTLRDPRPPWWFPLALILIAAIALRIWILASPLGEVEADESVVGLMALHIQAGERPLFYWGQPVLGSLEAYLVALAFSLVGPSNLALKSVPGLVFLIYLALVYVGARRAYGEPTALLSAI